MKNNIVMVVVLLILAAGAVLYVVGKQQPKMEPIENKLEEPTSSLPAASGSASPGTTMDKTVRQVVIEGFEFKFSPATLTLKKGEKVRIVLKNTGKMPHDWVVDELSVRTKVITTGNEDSVEFTPDTVGTFEYYCSIGKHREMGMKGTLTVVE